MNDITSVTIGDNDKDKRETSPIIKLYIALTTTPEKEPKRK